MGFSSKTVPPPGAGMPMGAADPKRVEPDWKLMEHLCSFGREHGWDETRFL